MTSGHNRREKERLQRRESIIDAGESVFFSRGISHATMDQVAKEAQLGKGTLYLYFSSKEDLLAAIYHRGMTLLKQMLEAVMDSSQKGLEKLQAQGEAYVRYSKNYNRYFQLIMQTDFQGWDEQATSNIGACVQAGMEILNLVAKVIKEGIEDKSIRSGIDPNQAALVVWGQMHGLIEVAAHQKTTRELFTDSNQDIPILCVKPEDVIKSGMEMILTCLAGKK